MKYIIDTDPGIDDAIAIAMGVLNGLDIIGFTLASGNIEISKSEENLKIIQDFLHSKIKMYKGEKTNKCNSERAERAHGKSGLGYIVLPFKSTRKFEREKAENFIIKASKKYRDNLTVVCFGPLTNLANALRKDKGLAKRLKHVIVMGVSYNPNIKKLYKEFNVSVDPKAANEVFHSNIEDIKVVTHEIGVRSFVEKDYVLNLRESDNLISRFIGLISERYIEFSYDHYGTIGLGTPDPTTMASILDPKIITYKPCSIDIIEGSLCDVKELLESNIQIAVDFDLERFRKIFKNTFK